MAKEEGATPKDENKGTEGATPEGLGEAGKKALEAEREARREAEKRLKALEGRLGEAEKAEKRLKEAEDADKTELQRATERLAQLERERDEASLYATRLEVAAGKGLSPIQAKRLVGATKEEIEADADELLESFRPAEDERGKPPTGRPRERLRGGAEPDEEPEPDSKKIAESVMDSSF